MAWGWIGFVKRKGLLRSVFLCFSEEGNLHIHSLWGYCHEDYSLVVGFDGRLIKKTIRRLGDWEVWTIFYNTKPTIEEETKTPTIHQMRFSLLFALLGIFPALINATPIPCKDVRLSSFPSYSLSNSSHSSKYCSNELTKINRQLEMQSSSAT